MKKVSIFLFFTLLIMSVSTSLKAQENLLPNPGTIDTVSMNPRSVFPLKMNGEILSPANLKDLFASNDAAKAEYQAAKGNRDLGMVLSYAGGFMIGWPLGQAIGGGDPNWVLAGVGAGLVILAIPLGSAYKKRTKKAVELYNNEKLQKPTEIVSFKLQNTSSGIGVVMRF